ncbi:NlpC/P60 family protein [Actinomadura atramentaria]|uniref:NlpC/P60 family protein n=1 Tax=Actinomadura atramentaria TaxID=1990 RepID=UPI0003A891A0|nr:NlpC/P60 family protein [Actinomadura atramentaria]
MADTPTPSSGTSGEDQLQRAVDALERTISRFARFLESKGAASPGASGRMGNGGWNSMSNWMGGRPNGGQVRQGPGGAMQVASMLARSGAGGVGGAGGGGTPNGGGSAFTGGGQGGSMGAGTGGGIGGGGGFLSMLADQADDQGGAMGLAGKAMGSWLDFGKRQMPDQLTMDAVASSVSMGTSMDPREARKQFLGQQFGRNGEGIPGIAFNVRDWANAAQMRRTMGTLPIPGATTARQRAGNVDFTQIGLTNPTLGAAGAARVQQQLAGPSSTFTFMNLGGRLSGGGSNVSMSQMSNQLLNRAGLNLNKMSAKDIETFFAQGGTGRIQAIESGWSEETVSAMRTNLQGQKKFMADGGNAGDWDRLAQKAADGDEEAKKKIGDYVGAQGVQKLKDLKGTKMSRSADINEDYMDSVEAAAGAATELEKALTNIINLPGIKQLVAASGGASVLDSVGKGGLIAGGLKIASGVGSAMSSVQQGNLPGAWNAVKGLLGGAGPEPMSKQTDKAPGGSGCDGADSGAVATMIKAGKSKLGTPYLLGAREGDTSKFDCSSFVQWMYSLAGKKITRTTQTQWRNDGRRVKPGEKLQPGDLLYRRTGFGAPPGHVGMYIGGGQVIDTGSNQTGGVKITKYSKARWDMGAKRILGCSLSDNAAANGQGGGAQGGSGPDQAGGQSVGQAMGHMGDKYGSVEEVEAIAGALSGADVGVGEDSATKERQTESNGASDQNNSGSSSYTGKIDWSKAKSGEVASYWDTGSDSSYGDTGAPACGKGMKKNHIAHRTLKCGTKVAFRHKGKVQIGEVGDRGPGIPDREYDISTYMMAQFGQGFWDPKRPKASGQGLVRAEYVVLGGGDKGSQPPGLDANGRPKRNAYATGAWETEDETADLHKGEMVLPKEVAEQVREVLAKASVFKTRPAQTGSGGGKLALHFGQGSVVFRVSGTVTPESAQAAARAFAQQLARERVYELMGAGG